ncbi:hypothetical protein AB1Y20_020214 [Prymnesium parvum]|uniref:Uncharacterized protein n=1 Tax=Prymnesium parvum TaxID=97485 RepID=A0AB34JYM5_PRYPA
MPEGRGRSHLERMPRFNRVGGLHEALGSRLAEAWEAWSQRLVEAADAVETRHALQVDDDAVTPSSAEPESTTAPTAHATELGRAQKKTSSVM